MPITKKRRVQFDVSEERVDELDELQDELGLRSRTALLNYAITLLAWVVQEKKEGRTFGSFNEDEGHFKEVVMPNLQNIKPRAETAH